MSEQVRQPRISQSGETGEIQLKNISASWAKNPSARKELLELIKRPADGNEKVTLDDIAAHLHIGLGGLRRTAEQWGGPHLDPVEAIKRVLEAVEKRDVENQKKERPENFRQKLIALEPSLKSFAISLTHNEETAKDLVQDTLLRAWEHYEDFTWGELGAWVFSIMKNSHFVRLKTEKSRRFQEPEIERDLYNGGSLFPTQGEAVDYKRVMEVVQRLPPECRQTYLLRRQGGLALEEIASVLNIPVGTVKSRVSRAEAEIDAAFPGLRK